MKPVLNPRHWLRGYALAVFTALAAALAPGVAHAQQDGPRGYMLGPEGVQAMLLIGTCASANQISVHGHAVVGSDVSSNVTAVQYGDPLNVAGRSAAIFPFVRSRPSPDRSRVAGARYRSAAAASAPRRAPASTPTCRCASPAPTASPTTPRACRGRASGSGSSGHSDGQRGAR
jgi:hypothetical protein